MFFNNIFTFAFTRKFDSTNLFAKLENQLFRKCGSTELSTFGWVNPLKVSEVQFQGDGLVHEGDGNILICAKRESKILPAPTIKEKVAEKIAQLENEQARIATKKEREQFKEDVIFELLPRAFTRIEIIHAYINIELNIIVINTRSKAEDFLSLLRKSIGSLPVTSVSPEKAPDETMTGWLTEHNLGAHFNLGTEAELKALGDDAAIAKVKNEDLTGLEVKEHLNSDKYVTKIALEYGETMSFIVSDDLSIKRIKYFDIITQQNDDYDEDDARGRLEADFILMAGELNRMLDAVFNEFGVNAKDCLGE